MAVPTNIDAASAVELGPLPNSITQDVRDTGTNYTVWYKYTADVTKVVGIFGFGAVSPGYQPFVEVFESDGVTPYLFISAVNLPFQMQVIGGETYYFEISSSTGNTPVTAILTLSGEDFTSVTAPIGSIIINDDTSGFPAVVLSGTTDYEAELFFRAVVAGEGGSILPSGEFLLQDLEGSGAVALYTSQFVLTLLIPTTLTLGRVITSNKLDLFYIGTPGGGGNPAKIATVTSVGVLSAVLWTFPVAGLVGLALDPDETILYNIGQTSTINAPVKRWDLAGSTMLSNLNTAPIGYTVGNDLLCLDDGTIIVGYAINGTDGNILHYAADGTLLNTYPFGLEYRSTDRLAYAIDDPNSFWVWTRRNSSGVNTGISTFRNIKVSDGSVLNTVNHATFESGTFTGVAAAVPVSRFGHSDSCPFLISRVSIPPPLIPNTNSGIYIVVPDKTFDELYTEDVKIPNPTVKTGFIGN